MTDRDFKHHINRNTPDKGHVIIDDVSISFKSRDRETVAVQSTSVEITPGEFVCILGPSGSGKSTLLNAVAGFVKPNTGTIKVDGDLVEKPGPERGMVFQQHSLFPWKTVLENITFGPRVSERGRGSIIEQAETFINMIGLSKYANSYPKELSGGMQQRVGIARALANYPSVLLMDEPFGALDSQTRAMMQDNLMKIWKEFGTTVLFVTHDVDEAIYLSDRVLIMSAGPGEIISDIAVPLPRPRGSDIITSSEYVKLRAQCMEHIRAESLKAFERQND